MFNFKKRREEKQRMEDFKKSIKGIFNDWSVDGDGYTARKDKYSVWINHGYSGFKDWRGSFLINFSKKERELLWKELQCRGFPETRSKIFKEFNLKGGENRNV